MSADHQATYDANSWVIWWFNTLSVSGSMHNYLALSAKIGLANEWMKIDSVKEGAGIVVVMSGKATTCGEVWTDHHANSLVHRFPTWIFLYFSHDPISNGGTLDMRYVTCLRDEINTEITWVEICIFWEVLRDNSCRARSLVAHGIFS